MKIGFVMIFLAYCFLRAAVDIDLYYAILFLHIGTIAILKG